MNVLPVPRHWFALLLVIFSGCAPALPVSMTAPTSETDTASLMPSATTIVSEQSSTSASQTGHVTRVIDGDTIEVMIDGGSYRVRYIGMNTPETHEVCGDTATEANSRLVGDQDVTLVKDVSETDRYGRLLRYVYVGDLFINAELVRLGFAEVATYPPDIAHVEEFTQLAAQAREADLGCWSEEILEDASQGVVATNPPNIPPQGGAAVCDCEGRDLDCGSFDTHDEAQACFEYCKSQGYGDVFRLDGEGDQIACESLP